MGLRVLFGWPLTTNCCQKPRPLKLLEPVFYGPSAPLLADIAAMRPFSPIQTTHHPRVAAGTINGRSYSALE